MLPVNPSFGGCGASCYPSTQGGEGLRATRQPGSSAEQEGEGVWGFALPIYSVLRSGSRGRELRRPSTYALRSTRQLSFKVHWHEDSILFYLRQA